MAMLESLNQEYVQLKTTVQNLERYREKIKTEQSNFSLSSNMRFLNCMGIVDNLNSEMNCIGFPSLSDAITIGILYRNCLSAIDSYKNALLSLKASGSKSVLVIATTAMKTEQATQYFVNWEQKDYKSLQTTLKALGFTNITVKEKETTIKTSNHLVASITLNKETYTGGDCFLQKTAPIVIEYYRLKITTNSSDDEYEDYENYSDLVDALKGQGFTNIELQRSDDLNWFEEWGAWIWSVPEGSIKSIIIDGVEDFESSASFFYDAKIVIVVNTYKGKGCDDITITAN